MKSEITQIQFVRAIVKKVDYLFYFLLVFWLAVRRHAHHFIFALIYLKTQKSRKSRVKESQRMREMNFFQDFYFVRFANADCSYRPFANTVNGQNRGAFIRRREKSGSGMG